MNPAEKAGVLVEALPYLNRFRGATLVVKYGGSAMQPSAGGGAGAADSSFATDVALLRAVGLRVVVVHGGGPQIGDLMARLGMEATFVDGLRVTDAETLDVARMVLVGKVNRDLVRAITAAGAEAVGVSGEDGGLLQARPLDPALGYVGEVSAVAPGILVRLLDQDVIPVVSTIGGDAAGQAYNINADTAAGAIAAALGADKLVYLTDVEGIRSDAGDPDTLLSSVSLAELDRLVDEGAVKAGMLPKVASCAHAVRSGVGSAHVLDGRVPHVLLLEIFTTAGIGTMVTSVQPEADHG